ncbi:HIT family protein [Xylocopilactobacillus apicola]|uniref:Histidine triad protein n=1 Tax=Xylocopilactobacillus apicola TaxID=2932184 RepID=A0AAU9DT37_9LACO|nr:HIT family protein [Xylocopilactobacillus apicola]BDR58508.1 histidine triad protein [Xylocopilactobacillus apicola]
MNDCIFCKIINGDVPSYKVYEDEFVYSFLDLSQTTLGHTLLIPKKHVKDVFEYDEKLAEAVFGRVPLVANALKQALPDLQGLNIINNNGELAGQSVFHSHIHFIPRYTNSDTFTLKFTDNSSHYQPERLAKLAEEIKNEI